LGNNIISRQEIAARDLGICTDSSLKFSSHISQIVAKAHARASVIHITCYKIEDGRRPPYWKLKNRHSSATITDISTEIGILIDMKLLLKLLAWQV